jgi:hypothetical protein
MEISPIRHYLLPCKNAKSEQAGKPEVIIGHRSSDRRLPPLRLLFVQRSGSTFTKNSRPIGLNEQQ